MRILKLSSDKYNNSLMSNMKDGIKIKKTTGAVIVLIIIGIFAIGILVGVTIGKNTSKEKDNETSKPLGYEEEVTDIENSYNGTYPKDKIIMYGSSSFRLWTTMSEDLAPLEVLNHGFGGASLDDAINYADRLVVAFKPKAVVIYCGTNDLGGLADGSIKDAKAAYEVSVALINYIKDKLPNTKVYYVASSPQPLRWNRWGEISICNKYMKEYCKSNEDVTYIDTEDVLLDKDGNYYPEYYLEDGLHFSEKGYKVWGEVIKDCLTKD